MKFWLASLIVPLMVAAAPLDLEQTIAKRQVTAASLRNPPTRRLRARQGFQSAEPVLSLPAPAFLNCPAAPDGFFDGGYNARNNVNPLAVHQTRCSYLRDAGDGDTLLLACTYNGLTGLPALGTPAICPGSASTSLSGSCFTACPLTGKGAGFITTTAVSSGGSGEPPMTLCDYSETATGALASQFFFQCQYTTSDGILSPSGDDEADALCQEMSPRALNCVA